MKLLSKRLLTTAVLAGLSIPTVSMATNGYFLIGYGAKSRAMGGVGIAYAQDGLAAAANPATMVDVETRFDIGGDIFKPVVAVFNDSDNLPANHESTAGMIAEGYFLVPNMGGVWQYSDDITLGFAMVGAGLGTEYDQTCSNPDGSFFNFNCQQLIDSGNDQLASTKLGVDLVQAQMLPSIAYKINDQHSVGATLAIGIQRFKAWGLGAFAELGFAAGTDNVTNQGISWSYGAGIRLGWQGKFMEERLKVGVNYASKVYMTEFDEYKNLFAEQGDFDIPENYGIGIAFAATKDLDVVLDITRTIYSGVASISNKGPQVEGGFFECGSIECGALGKDQGLGFGWDDQTVYKLGVNYALNSSWNLRAGYNYGEKPMANDQVLFALLGPGIVEQHLTMGFTYVINKNSELSASYVHAFEESLVGAVPASFSARPAGEANAAATMYQDSIGVSYGYIF